ncbi:hypothetical protein GOP47_0021674 [Adiantum capillus-veneris]|uniref:beta-aspartyl-peptidase n=1 Tax=Adiantum capillus-veneris TaxID=13818 RepID=A0A9D4Z765_ADICA|nr:hypothetical protein GOP47_0021674 [Adiantum capillus-veneris]
MKWAIALHGGAGDISKDMPLQKKEEVETALSQCLQLGISALRDSCSAMDVAELVVRALEDNPLFNAGRGSVLTTEGTIEMEASIMDGPSRKCGAVSGLTSVINPISLARLVMEKTPHVYLAFAGAEMFARQQGVATAEPKYFLTEKSTKQLHAVQQLLARQTCSSEDITYKEAQPTCKLESSADVSLNGTLSGSQPFIGETVGCVVIDKLGHCVAATSTGGRTNKMVGRIGDTPLVGAGNYANHLCAVSATGIGEYIIRGMVGHNVAAIMEYKGASLAEAVTEVIDKQVEQGTTGLVAVSSSGELAMAFNTTGMYRAAADESGYYEVGIWN